MKKKIVLPILFFGILVISFIYLVLKPSNDRNWEVGFDKLTQVNISGSIVDFKNIRNYKYSQNGIESFDHIDRQVDASKITRVWFVVEPFGSLKAIAHTYLVFDFEEGDPIILSVEARREKGETYDAFTGMFNQYELIYLWSTESDQTIRRVILENNKLYMYPLNISQDKAQTFFLDLAKRTHELESTPRFYNTLFANCTNELFKTAKGSFNGIFPVHISYFMPGYSHYMLYNNELIPNDKPVDEIQQQYFISDNVKEVYNQEDFSKALRSTLEY